eukprot:2394511-Alexandrium_andersonii.AAC.1
MAPLRAAVASQGGASNMCGGGKHGAGAQQARIGEETQQLTTTTALHPQQLQQHTERRCRRH